MATHRLGSLGVTLACAALLAGCGGGGRSVPEGTPEAVEQAVTLPGPTWNMASDGESLWVTTDDAGASRVDLDSGEVGSAVPDVVGVNYGEDGRLWALSERAVLELDPRTGAVLRRLAIPNVADGVAFGGGSMWTYRWKGDSDEAASVVQIDPDALRVVSDDPVSDCVDPRDIVYAYSSAWIACKGSGHVLRVGHGSDSIIATIPTGRGPHHLAEGAGSIWVTNYRADTVSRIDPSTNEVVANVPGLGTGIGIAFTDGGVWAAGANGIGRIDPATNRIDEELPLVELGDYYYDIVPVDDSLWLSTVDHRQAWRVPLP